MSNDDIEKIRLKKAEMLIKSQIMPKEIVKVHSIAEYDKLLKDYPEKVIIIDFWAIWCGPCMMFAPIFEKLQQEHAKEFVFVKVNVDENPSIAQRYRITGIPTTLFIKNEKVVHKIVGAVNQEYMERVLEKLKSFSK
ncbi:MAG: thioredoxin [Candidatus Hodarchaeota archaeon]